MGAGILPGNPAMGVDIAARRGNNNAMKRFIAQIFAGLLLLAHPAHAAAADDTDGALTLTFIGNEAFAISDGAVTLVSDFPYRSGYSVYMEYDPAALEISGDVLALITHRHSDHFDPALFLANDWWIVAPREITDGLAKSRVIPMAGHAEFLGIKILPVPTPHSTTEHYSYLVAWRGRSLYFFGDTEEPDEFLALGKKVDVAFITPWVLRSLLAEGTDIPADRIVIYHQRVGESLPQCDKCRALAQGESLTLD